MNQKSFLKEDGWDREIQVGCNCFHQLPSSLFWFSEQPFSFTSLISQSLYLRAVLMKVVPSSQYKYLFSLIPLRIVRAANPFTSFPFYIFLFLPAFTSSLHLCILTQSFESLLVFKFLNFTYEDRFFQVSVSSLQFEVLWCLSFLSFEYSSRDFKLVLCPLHF